MSSRHCNQPYRICKKGHRALNVTPPPCLLEDKTYSELYCRLYTAILKDHIDLALQSLLEVADPAAGAIVYAGYLQKILQIFGITEGIQSPRVLIAESDGTVVLDTAKTNNTYANWKAGAIGPNHNTRVAIMTAQIFEAGVGYEQKYSSTLSVVQKYVAIRGGPFLNNPGTFRISQNV